MKDGFKLSEDTPTVSIQKRMAVTDEKGQRKQKITVDEYDIAGKFFSEIGTKLQEKLKDKVLSVIVLTDCTDEEIEDQFYRLNNGTALTKDQKTRVLLGDELSAFIDRVEASEFFSEKSHKSYFTSLQRKRGEVQTCILQTLMLVMDYQFKNFNNDATMEFAEWFRANHKNSDFEYCEELFSKQLHAKRTTTQQLNTAIKNNLLHITKAECHYKSSNRIDELNNDMNVMKNAKREILVMVNM